MPFAEAFFIMHFLAQEKDKQNIEHRYIEVVPSTYAEMSAGQVSRRPGKTAEPAFQAQRYSPYGKGKGKGVGKGVPQWNGAGKGKGMGKGVAMQGKGAAVKGRGAWSQGVHVCVCVCVHVSIAAHCHCLWVASGVVASLCARARWRICVRAWFGRLGRWWQCSP